MGGRLCVVAGCSSRLPGERASVLGAWRGARFGFRRALLLPHYSLVFRKLKKNEHGGPEVVESEFSSYRSRSPSWVGMPGIARWVVPDPGTAVDMLVSCLSFAWWTMLQFHLCC